MKQGNIKTWFGLFDMLQFKVQEKFWGYRYLYKSYMDEYRFGSSADLGTGIQYTPFKDFQWQIWLSVTGRGIRTFNLIMSTGSEPELQLNPLKA